VKLNIFEALKIKRREIKKELKKKELTLDRRNKASLFVFYPFFSFLRSLSPQSHLLRKRKSLFRGRGKFQILSKISTYPFPERGKKLKKKFNFELFSLTIFYNNLAKIPVK